MITELEGESWFEKRNLKFTELLKNSDGSSQKIAMDLICKTSRIYLEQLDCLVFSEKGYNTVPLRETTPLMSEVDKPLLSNLDLEEC